MGLPLHCISTVVFKSVQIALEVCVSDLSLEGAILKRMALYHFDRMEWFLSLQNIPEKNFSLNMLGFFLS